jgi:uncharacterized protein (TIGR02246 family)
MAGTETAFEKIASAFVNGYNARDPEAWARIFHPDGEYHPTVLVGSRTVYTGRDEIREYIREVKTNDRGQQAAWKQVRPCSEASFVMCGEVLIDGEVVTEATVIFELKDGLIVRGKAYLTDDETLERLGLLPAALSTES